MWASRVVAVQVMHFSSVPFAASPMTGVYFWLPWMSHSDAALAAGDSWAKL